MSDEQENGFSISDALLPLLDVALVLLGLFLVLFSLATLDPIVSAQTGDSEGEEVVAIRPASQAQVAVLVFRGGNRWVWRGNEVLDLQGFDDLRQTLGRFRDSLSEGPGVVMLVDEAQWTPDHDSQFLQTRRIVLETGLRLGRAY